jgi:hypothetical protein
MARATTSSANLAVAISKFSREIKLSKHIGVTPFPKQGGSLVAAMPIIAAYSTYSRISPG